MSTEAHEKALAKLTSKPKEQLTLLIQLFKESKVTVKLLTSKAEKFKITAVNLNFLAVKVSSGKDGLKQNKAQSREIYELAIQKGSLLAKSNLAWSLLTSPPQNQAKAYLIYAQLFSRHSEPELKNAKHKILYYSGLHYFNNGEYKKAWESLRLVPEKINIENESKPNPNYPAAQAKLEEIKQLAQTSLEELFFKAPETLSLDEEENPDPAAASEEDEAAAEEVVDELSQDDEPVPTFFHPLSESLEMYDPTQDQETIIKFKKAELEFEMAKSNFSAAEDALEKAENDGEPDFLTEALTELKDQKKLLCDDARNLFLETREPYTELMSQGNKKLLRREVQTEKHFFAIERNQKPETTNIATHFLNQRQRPKNEDGTALVATNVPVRRLITAEIAVIRSSLSVMGTPVSYSSAFPWTIGRTSSYTTSRGTNVTQLFSPKEEVQCGAATIKYDLKINPHQNHVGDFYMESLGTYTAIYKILRTLFMNEENIDAAREQQLATWMLRYTKTGAPITLQELKQLKPDADKKLLASVMRIFYHCFVREPSSWMIAINEAHELPLATAQLRAVRLIIAGKLHIKDVFNSDSDYGVFTGKEIGSNIPALQKKVDRINKLYLEEYVAQQGNNQALHLAFMQEHKKATPLSTRSGLHEELVKDFGGDSDTDGEGYDSDTAEALYSGPYKFGQLGK